MPFTVIYGSPEYVEILDGFIAVAVLLPTLFTVELFVFKELFGFEEDVLLSLFEEDVLLFLEELLVFEEDDALLSLFEVVFCLEAVLSKDFSSLIVDVEIELSEISSVEISVVGETLTPKKNKNILAVIIIQFLILFLLRNRLIKGIGIIKIADNNIKKLPKLNPLASVPIINMQPKIHCKIVNIFFHFVNPF